MSHPTCGAPMSKPVDRKKKDHETRMGNVLNFPTNGDALSERPLKGRKTPRRSRSQDLACPPVVGWSTLSSDPRFLDEVRRALDASPEWNPPTRSAYARILAIGFLGLAGLDPISELIRSGSINPLSPATLGSAAMLFFSAACWRIGRSDGPARINVAPRENGSDTDGSSGIKRLKFDKAAS